MSDSLDINIIKIETEATKKSLEIRRDKKPPMCQRISMSVSSLLNYCNRVLFLCKEIEESKNELKPEPGEFTKHYYAKLKPECSQTFVSVWRKWLENCLREIDRLLTQRDYKDKTIKQQKEKQKNQAKAINQLEFKNKELQNELAEVKKMLEQ